jgi:hypothetical protein
MVFYHSIVSRIENKDFKFCLIWSNFGCISVLGEYAKVFQQLMRTSLGQYFNHGKRDVTHIRAPREKNAIKNFHLSTAIRKYHSAYSLYALNELNLTLYSVPKY